MSASSLTIGIPTYVGGPSLVKTVESLLSSEYRDFRLIVSVDGKKLDPEIKAAITKDPRVEVIENEVRRGQVGGIRQIIGLNQSDLLFLTQDDLLFDREMVGKIVALFEQDPVVTMVAAEGVPLPPAVLFERVVHAGFYVARRIERMWNQGDNYLLATGRGLAFRKPMADRIREEIQEEVISCDAHFYFINKKAGGKFAFADGAKYYLRSPKTLHDHIKQSQKFLALPEELKKYRGIDLDREHPLPVEVKMRATVLEFLRNPFYLSLYMLVLFYTRLKKNPFLKASRFWDVDLSTKEI